MNALTGVWPVISSDLHMQLDTASVCLSLSLMHLTRATVAWLCSRSKHADPLSVALGYFAGDLQVQKLWQKIIIHDLRRESREPSKAQQELHMRHT